MPSFRTGDEVVLLDGRQGMVRFVGKISPSKPGRFYGISLSKGKGDHNGKYKDKYYFTCPKNKGIFVKKNEIKGLKVEIESQNRGLFDERISSQVRKRKNNIKIERKAGVPEKIHYTAIKYKEPSLKGSFLDEKPHFKTKKAKITNTIYNKLIKKPVIPQKTKCSAKRLKKKKNIEPIITEPVTKHSLPCEMSSCHTITVPYKGPNKKKREKTIFIFARDKIYKYNRKLIKYEVFQEYPKNWDMWIVGAQVYKHKWDGYYYILLLGFGHEELAIYDIEFRRFEIIDLPPDRYKRHYIDGGSQTELLFKNSQVLIASTKEHHSPGYNLWLYDIYERRYDRPLVDRSGSLQYLCMQNFGLVKLNKENECIIFGEGWQIIFKIKGYQILTLDKKRVLPNCFMQYYYDFGYVKYKSKYIITFGGGSSDKIFLYDIVYNKWKKLDIKLDTVMERTSCTILNDKIHVIGGVYTYWDHDEETTKQCTIDKFYKFKISYLLPAEQYIDEILNYWTRICGVHLVEEVAKIIIGTLKPEPLKVNYKF